MRKNAFWLIAIVGISCEENKEKDPSVRLFVFSVLGFKGLMKLIRFRCSFVFQTLTVVSTTRLTLNKQRATGLPAAFERFCSFQCFTSQCQ